MAEDTQESQGSCSEGPEVIKAVDHLRCEHCVAEANPTQTTKVGPPKPYVFNHEVGVDVLEMHDVNEKCNLFLNIVFAKGGPPKWRPVYLNYF